MDLKRLAKLRKDLREQRDLHSYQGAEVTAFNLCLILSNLIGELEKHHGNGQDSSEKNSGAGADDR